MKRFKILFVALLAGTLTLSACAKKDSEFAARYAKNRMGADVVDGVKTQEAGEQAAAQGLEADIVGVQRHWTPDGQPGPRLVTAKILINNTEFSVSSHHYGTEVVNGSVDVNGYSVRYHAVCAEAACNPYYAAMEVYQNGRILIQEGIRVYFDKTTSEHRDVYQWLSPGNELPLMGADDQDVRGMVGYLNQAGAGSGSELIK